MQECLVCQALLLEELVLKVLLIASAVVVVVAILAVFLLSPACLVVLASVLAALIFCEVYSEVHGQLSTCKVTCREELRACSFALLVRVVGRPASFLLAYKALLLPAWLESTYVVHALFVSSKCTFETSSTSRSASGSTVSVVSAVEVVLICSHMRCVLSCEVCLDRRP